MDRYNEARPHSALDGQTPNKVYNGLRPANRRPRIEPRDRWQRRSSCAKPYALVAGKPGDNYIEEVQQLPDRMKITSTRTTFIMLKNGLKGSFHDLLGVVNNIELL